VTVNDLVYPPNRLRSAVTEYGYSPEMESGSAPSSVQPDQLTQPEAAKNVVSGSVTISESVLLGS
jgi:hypothetical protein